MHSSICISNAIENHFKRKHLSKSFFKYDLLIYTHIDLSVNWFVTITFANYTAVYYYKCVKHIHFLYSRPIYI